MGTQVLYKYTRKIEIEILKKIETSTEYIGRKSRSRTIIIAHLNKNLNTNTNFNSFIDYSVE